MARIYVIDTSYLDELFSIHNHSTATGTKEVRKRYKRAIDLGDSLFVPLPCIFEVGNHIAQIQQGGLRAGQLGAVAAAVRTSFERGVPFVVTPADLPDIIDDVFHAFTDELAVQGIGMTDAFIIREALRLKALRGNTTDVHIWTRDVALKAREPDAEADPFV